MKLTHSLRWLFPIASLGLATPALAESVTPEQALSRAAARSPELRAALYDLAAAEAAIAAEDRKRGPVLTGSLHATHGAQDGVDAAVGVSTTTSIGTVINLGADASFDGAPTSSATFGIDVRQPLLRGAGEDVVLAGLRQARLAERAARADRDRSASQLAESVLTAYWEVWYAERALRVQKAALALTEQQLAEVQKKVEVLKSAPAIDLLRLASERASQRGELSRAEATLESRQITLARLLGVSLAAARELSAAAEPSLQPTARAGDEDLDALTTLAVANAYELAAQRADLESARIEVRSARDAATLRLDLVGSFSAGALWNDSFDGFAWSGGRPGIIAMIGIEGELPFGASDADARAEQAEARLNASLARYEAATDELAAEVARTRRELVEAEDALGFATETASIAQKLAASEAEKLRLGTAILTDLVIAQQTARSAELQALRAQANVETTRLALDALTGRLLPRVAALAPALASPNAPTEN